MENASKALIMAGSVLIALMIIGALLLMFNNLSNYQKTDTRTIEEAQVIEFNNQYETYNRKNVRGSDLYSLLNKVVDYNRRKSTEGTGKDEGQNLAYQPMTVSFDLKPGGGKEALYVSTDSNEKFTNHLIKSDTYTVSNTTNQFETEIYKRVKDLENKYGEDSLNNLIIGMSKIFIDKQSSDIEKQAAIDTFNIASKKVSVKTFKELNDCRNDVYTYAEYVQFKRAKFDCMTDKIEYNSKTGRIVKMEFKFTGKFE